MAEENAVRSKTMIRAFWYPVFIAEPTENGTQPSLQSEIQNRKSLPLDAASLLTYSHCSHV
jgi:hypothetical protein